MDGSPTALIPRWLLDTLVLYRLDVTVLTWDHETLEEDLNRRIPDFEAEDIARSIMSGMDRELLDLVGSIGGPIRVSSEGLERAMRGEPQQFFLGLTESGGEHWESIAHPIWERFFNCERLVQPGETHSMFIEALHKDYCYEILNDLSITGDLPVRSTVRWSKVAPWDATYWKSFQEGNCLEFLAIEVRRDDSSPTPDWFSRNDYWYF
jgi:hypothetical protein